jgi:hypothetical protein
LRAAVGKKGVAVANARRQQRLMEEEAAEVAAAVVSTAIASIIKNAEAEEGARAA